MKKLFVGVLAIASMVACMNEETVRVQDPAAIGFEANWVENATRANEAVDPSTTTESLTGFKVWGFMDSVDGKVFEGEEVTGSKGNFTYNNIAYWLPGHTYYFAALAPIGGNWTLNTKAANNYGAGVVSFTNENGTEDLLYAANVESAPALGEAKTVNFTFSHLLSKVKFTFTNGFTNENMSIDVKNVRIVNAPAAGTIDLAVENWWDNNGDWALCANADVEKTVELAFGDACDKTAMGETQVAANERLTIPASSDYEYEVKFEVALYMGGVEAYKGTKTSKVSGVALEMGKAYNFSATLNASNFTEEGKELMPIEFDVVEVKDWVEETINGGAVEDELIVLNEVVTSADEMAAALKSDANIINVKMANDIVLPISSLGQMTGGSGEYKLGGEKTVSITIDLNGKKLSVDTTYWSNLGAKNNNALFTIKNGTMTSSQPTGTWNSYDLTFSNCDYVFENVTFEKAIAFDNAGKSVSLKDVTINETHDYYAMWITAAGQNVTIDGLTVNSANGRGIKIDEQYVGTPANVTLNIANSTFTTAKKAAILVKSVAGAEINVSNVNIANVAADNEFAVWVDEDAAAYADKVVVNGALVKVEGAKDAIASSSTELAEAVQNGAKNVYLENGTYTLASYPAGLKLVGCGDNVVLDATGKKYGVNGDVTIENVKLLFSNANYTGFQHTNVESYKNCTIVGQPFLYGNDVTFEGCTFEQTSADAYNVWTYGAKNVKFVGCEFNCAGKSVLIYAEGSSNGQVALFEGCTLNASAPVEGKAAIEIDSSLIKGVYDITINDTTATGFANGNVSGKSLWNNKKGDKATITVDGVKVL